MELIPLAVPTAEAMREALLDQDKEIHVLHFMGHGGYDSRSGAGAIFFEKSDGADDQVDGEELAAFLKRIPSLRLVVLNSCKTARHKGSLGSPSNYGAAAKVLLRTGIPALVAHQCSISSAAAIQFSKIFYREIARGAGVDEAITEVRLRMWRKSAEWGNSVLFLNGPTARVLALKSGRRGKSAGTGGPPAEAGPVRLGVRSIDGWGSDMEDSNDHVLDITGLFQGRRIKDKSWWQERVFPKLRTFLKLYVEERRPLLLDFAAHSSIAFAAGWLLEPKSGLDVRIRQRTGGVEGFEWHTRDGSDPGGPLWQEREERGLERRASDVAVALSVSQPDVAEEVEDFIRKRKLSVGRLLDAVIAPEPCGRSVKGGEHAFRLAQALQTSSGRAFPERSGRVHFFCSGPNALVFYLGQLASSLGRIVLYEYPFRAENSYGRYQKSIELPPPDEVERVEDDW